jgi:galactonate dehydratase
MKITSITPIVCNARMRNWIFVKVLTDQPGLWGWGEATLEWHTRSVVGAIEDLSPLLIGQDPRRIERLWQSMWRQHFWHGGDLVRSTAISGIDIALWDILGKTLGVPCHQLLGGSVRDSIRLYSHLGGGRMEDFYESPTEEPSRFADLAEQAVAEGFTAFKSMAIPETMPLEGTRPVRMAEACVSAMREAVGPDIDIMVDGHARPSPAMGRQFASALEPYGLYWLEEICWPEQLDAMAQIAASVSTPIATGERMTCLYQFRDLGAKGAAQVWQPDITHCGGLTGVKKIAALAESWRAAIAPHNPQGPVSTSASLEFGFSCPDYVICEQVHNDVPWREDVVQEGYTVEAKGRIVRPSNRPGLGVEINELEAAKHPFAQEEPQLWNSPDGSVGDW